MNIKLEELPFANNLECKELRKKFINNGIIKLNNNSDFVKKNNGALAVSTEKYTNNLRSKLIKKGLIDPNYIELVPEKTIGPFSEEGQYEVKPIQNKHQYEKRLKNYFRMLQEILVSRRELNLNLAPKSESDPNWIF